MEENHIVSIIDAHMRVAENLKSLSPQLAAICRVCGDAISRGNKILLAGNGGSAADAQHIAAEFTGRFVKERHALAAIALTTDTSALTAIANDYGFREVFARQLAALGNRGDVFIAISTSGNSPSIVRAQQVAKEKQIITIGFLGNNGGALAQTVDHALIVPSHVTARIQEMHILAGHILCEYVDNVTI